LAFSIALIFSSTLRPSSFQVPAALASVRALTAASAFALALASEAYFNYN